MLKVRKTLIATAIFLASGSLVTTVVTAVAPMADSAKLTTGADGAKLATGLSPLAQLLELMDTDKNGKVSKEEFMNFMQAEFEFADKNKDGELDPVELKGMVQRMNHPYFKGSPRVR